MEKNLTATKKFNLQDWIMNVIVAAIKGNAQEKPRYDIGWYYGTRDYKEQVFLGQYGTKDLWLFVSISPERGPWIMWFDRQGSSNITSMCHISLQPKYDLGLMEAKARTFAKGLYREWL